MIGRPCGPRRLDGRAVALGVPEVRRRPAIACERLSRDGDSLVVYELKHPFRDGITHPPSKPRDLLARCHAEGRSGSKSDA